MFVCYAFKSINFTYLNWITLNLNFVKFQLISGTTNGCPNLEGNGFYFIGTKKCLR
jgi:hypothetical protein